VVQCAETVVDAAVQVGVPVYAEPGEGDVGCGDAELEGVSLDGKVGGD
jgi:hypothetical protein